MREALVTATIVYRDGRRRTRTFRAMDWTIADLRSWIIASRGGTIRPGRPIPPAWPIVRAIVRGKTERRTV